MTHRLFEHINHYTTVSKADFEEILSHFELQTYDKKALVTEVGTRCNFNHFVLEGCLHMCFINQKGMESTIQFAIENWWMTDHLAYINRTNTDFSIQAVERTHLLRISFEQQQKLLATFPQLEKYFRSVYEISYGAALMRTKYLHDFSKEDIYLHFTEHFPDFAQRVPQYLIASFLGLTPEYVSEIRKKKRS